ncbi:MAG: peptidoglycan-associated lipoprotein Pal [Zetaproteobacteria bacterium]|nr:peptidoglycan-associated lipoprotein Pal [Zetaproteobacteria bacterium]
MDATDNSAAASIVILPSAPAIYFAFDSYVIDGASATTLQAYAAWLKADGNRTMNIEGHCDQRGSREYNLALGQQRAEAVKSFLMAEGVASNSISTISYGEEKPACVGTGEACWAQNRRAALSAH